MGSGSECGGCGSVCVLREWLCGVRCVVGYVLWGGFLVGYVLLGSECMGEGLWVGLYL